MNKTLKHSTDRNGRDSVTGALHRSGFTLLELLIVVVVISIIAGMLLPALQRVLGSANAAAVKAELTQLETAISKFKSDFDVEPPSAVILTEDPGSTAWDTASRTKLRRIWGDYPFTGTNDFNNDGDTSDVLTLTSSECLVFFLGGMRGGPDGTTLTGFSKNPANPFSTTGENRTSQYYEFDIERFVDNDTDGMPEYLDAFGEGQPLIYASSNNGQGYQKILGAPMYFVQSDGTTAWKRDSFQLISSGADGEFGFSETINPGTDDPIPYSDAGSATGKQADNISNFTTGSTMGD